MKLSAVDLEDEDFKVINSPDRFNVKLGIDDAKLSMNIPILVRYDYIDIDKTEYNFSQIFHNADTKAYFARMKDMAGHSMNELIENARELHFYRSPITGKLRDIVADVIPDAIRSNQIVYHFGLYTSPNGDACRDKDIRSPRIYFILGTYGHIYILFFDPYHEINK